MAKRTGINVNGDNMTVKEYAAMLEGAFLDAYRRLDMEEDVEIASFALPDPCAFDIEVTDAMENGRITERTWKMLYNKARDEWNAFRAELENRGLDATGYDNFR